MLFPVDKKLVSLAGMKDRLKDMFQLNKKLLPLAVVFCCLRKWKKIVSTEKQFSIVKIHSFFQNWLPIFSVTVSTCRKNLWTKENGFHQPENLFPLDEMKVFLEKYFSARRKKKSLLGISEKWRKNDFH